MLNTRVSLKEKLTELEEISRRLELDQEIRNQISSQATSYVDNFIENLPTLPGFQDGECKQLKKLSFENHGKPFDELLHILKDEVDAVGINSASGAHLGYIPGGGIWTSAVADMLAAATNRYAGIAYSSPGAVEIENQLIEWLGNVVGYPDSAHGNLTSGGSIANLIAIKAARDFHNIHSQNVRNSVIYLTHHAHHCIKKALNLTGLHEAVLRTIPMNNRYQMNTDALQKQIEMDRQNGLNPFLIIATAGTTDTGAIDPLERISELSSKYNTWFHVDAAYGGFFLLVDGAKAKFKGIEKSDSVVMDPHKTLFIPYGSGVVLVRNRERLLNSFSEKAAYMKDSYDQLEISPSETGPELSRHFRGLRMWLPLHLHGLEPFRENLEEKLMLCRYFHTQIGELGFETGPDPELSITCFRYPEDEGNELTQKLLEALHNDGRYFFSSTMMDEKLWIRCAVVSFRTHLREIESALQMIQEVSSRIR